MRAVPSIRQHHTRLALGVTATAVLLVSSVLPRRDNNVRVTHDMRSVLPLRWEPWAYGTI